MTHGWIRPLPALALAVLAALAAPGRTDAEDTNTIRACVSNEGKVRLLVSRDGREHGHKPRNGDRFPCHRHERLVTWNIIGPQGPQGDPGPPGEKGPAGPGFLGVQHYTVGNGDLRPVGGGLFAMSFVAPPFGTFSTGAAQVMAGVHLPQGAMLLGLTAHVLDNSAADLAIELIEQRLGDGTAVLLSSAASSGAAGAPQAIEGTPLAPRTIDNQHFHYFVRVTPTTLWTTTTLQVLGVTIAYTMEAVPGT
ncbi:MAG: hypothetical protein ACRD26_21355 [Vicinamibacterales bacterium]